MPDKKEPIHYGDYGAKDDEELIELRETLMDRIEMLLGNDQIKVAHLHELMEVERELTLREDQ